MAAVYELVDVAGISKKDVYGCDFSFELASRVAPPLKHIIETKPHVTSIEQSYRKQYDVDFDSILSPADAESKQLFAVVKTDGRVREYIHVREMWNKTASLEDIAIDSSLRGQGTGKALVHRALEWTRAEDLHCPRAETQDKQCRGLLSVSILWVQVRRVRFPPLHGKSGASARNRSFLVSHLGYLNRLLPAGSDTFCNWPCRRTPPRLR